MARRCVTTASLSLRDSASGKMTVFSADDSSRRQQWYACGPTVYDAAHLGHGRTYVMLDMLVRVAREYSGIELDYAMGVTDIDDKIIARAAELDLSPSELARREEVKFFEDMRRLGCDMPSRILRVSEHVDDVVSFIKDIEDQGMAYATKDGSAWFDVAKLDTLYGTFAEGKGTSAAVAAAAGLNATSSTTGKKDERDFCLWKASKPGEPQWDSPWGKGRPGWHIECSAMTRAAFGDNLDLHAGGVDLAFPHHENEIAQWRGARGEDRRGEVWCGCWVHTGHLHIEGRKMSKSLKNFITIRELLEQTTPDDFRLFCALHRYRSTVSFGEDRINDAKLLRVELELALLAARDALRESNTKKASSRMPKRFGEAETALAEAAAGARSTIKHALLDDLDTPKALAALSELATRTRQYVIDAQTTGGLVPEPVDEAAETIASTLRKLGFGIPETAWYQEQPSSSSSPSSLDNAETALQALVDLRSQVRSAALGQPSGDFRNALLSICDKARDDPVLNELGFAMVDTPDGNTVLTRAAPKTSEDETVAVKQPTKEDKSAGLRDIPPDQLFQVAEEFKGKFSAFDEATGLPLADAEGNALSKSMTKKLKKRLEKHTTKWDDNRKKVST